ncbi:MAG: hypothetical protein JWP87_679 [Labilithrix sp.]|nr:hypothetical protein [Labilithrix sp.]
MRRARSVALMELAGSAARRQLARGAPRGSHVDHRGILADLCQNDGMTRLLAHVLSAALVTGAVASCSSSNEREPDFVDPDVPGRDVNPDGVAYPTDHLGGHPRSGKRPGDRIPNFTFQAYVEGDRAAGLQTVSLADYFDPQQKRQKILHIEVSAVWCAICSSVTDATVKVKEPLGKEGVVYLEVMTAGASGASGPALGEVDDWVTGHQSNITTAIDVKSRRLAGIGVDPGVRPWDIVVDTRTMEILDSSGGSPLDIVKYDRSYVQLVGTYAPPY